VHTAAADASTGSSYASDLSASRLVTLADQLDDAARLEIDGVLG
jgi:hypothetical protein